MNNTYLFYDLETSGLNKAFDQVLQFAAIRTDQQFNELERYNFYVKLNPDIVPTPQAIITHRISIDTLNQQGLCEYEAIKKIHLILNQPGTISLGFNSLGFDDEFLRFSFYRNLFSPYTHQWANGCYRADLYPMIAVYYLYKNSLLTWPKINGKIRLKLEYLSEKNNLAKGQAHDAMVDVDATVNLAKILSQEKSTWDYLMSYFLKPIDLNRMANLKEALMVDGQFGSEVFFQSQVLFLGRHHYYQNQTFWLRLDCDCFNDMSKDVTFETPSVSTDDSDFPHYRYVIKRKDAEPKFLLPLEKRFLKYISENRQKMILDNKKFLKENSDLLKKIKKDILNYQYPIIPNLDIDAALYQNNFLTYEERNQCLHFHQLSPEKKSEFIAQFNSPILREQAVRILARNYPNYLPEKYISQYELYLKKLNPENEDKILIDYRYKKRLTTQKALVEIQTLKFSNDLDQQQLQLLKELESYIQ